MKKIFKSYFVIWGVLVILFNVVSFVSIGWAGEEKYTPSFWIGYIFILLTFIGQLACTYFALKGDDLTKTFYNISLITISYTGLISTFVVGGACMIISSLPYWVGIIVCAVVLAFNVISVVKTSVAIDLVAEIDEKIKNETLFIKSLRVDAELLINKAKDEGMKADLKKLYELVRYSDPRENEALASLETVITIKFAELIAAVEEGLDVKELVSELKVLIEERNNKCKILK